MTATETKQLAQIALKLRRTAELAADACGPVDLVGFLHSVADEIQDLAVQPDERWPERRSA